MPPGSFTPPIADDADNHHIRRRHQAVRPVSAAPPVVTQTQHNRRWLL
jgi:hypothetical protein